MWSAPTFVSGQKMCVDFYYVLYSFESETMCVTLEATESEFTVSKLTPFTFIFFTIRAECKGRLGPEVFIGHSTGNGIQGGIMYLNVYYHHFIN